MFRCIIILSGPKAYVRAFLEAFEKTYTLATVLPSMDGDRMDVGETNATWTLRVRSNEELVLEDMRARLPCGGIEINIRSE